MSALHAWLKLWACCVQVYGSTLFPVDALIAHVSRYSTWKTGDLLFTGTPAGVGPVQSGDHLEGRLGGRTMFALDVL